MAKNNRNRKRKRPNHEHNRQGAVEQVDDKNNNLSRRDWLKRIIGGASVLAVGGGGIAWLNSGASDSSVSPLSEKPITQRDVDAEYAALYEMISKAKEESEADGKHLVVLGGEIHNNRNSLLLEFMLVDIAHRLGIKNLFEEQDEATLSKMEQDAKQQLTARDRATPQIAGDEDLTNFVKHAFILSSMKGLPHDKLYSIDTPVDVNNTFLSMIVAKDHGMDCHAVDPKNKQRYQVAMEGDQSRIFSDTFENPMHDAITKINQEQHAIGFLGAGHAPEICKKLEASGAHVVGVDLTAGMRFKNDSNVTPIIRERMDRLDELYVPRIKTKQQVHPAQALAMTLEASTKHQEKQGEIDPDGAKMRLNLLENLRPKEVARNR